MVSVTRHGIGRQGLIPRSGQFFAGRDAIAVKTVSVPISGHLENGRYLPEIFGVGAIRCAVIHFLSPCHDMRGAVGEDAPV